jgi:hypothetical protein
LRTTAEHLTAELLRDERRRSSNRSARRVAGDRVGDDVEPLDGHYGAGADHAVVDERFELLVAARTERLGRRQPAILIN